MAISYKQPGLPLAPVLGRRSEPVPWWQTLLRPARWLWRRVRQRIALHRTQAHLEALDERTLKDIGLNRMDLRYLSRKESRLGDWRDWDLTDDR